jgi:hypothetical protein
MEHHRFPRGDHKIFLLPSSSIFRYRITIPTTQQAIQEDNPEQESSQDLYLQTDWLRDFLKALQSVRPNWVESFYMLHGDSVEQKKKFFHFVTLAISSVQPLENLTQSQNVLGWPPVRFSPLL